MVEWGREVIANLTTAAKAQNLYYPFIYLNDAYNGQQPFPFYGEGKSLPKLNAAAQKYDPQGVFKNLLTGVFKLDGSIVASL